MSPVGLQVRVLARRALLELWREPVVLALVVGLPVFFFLLVAVGYSHEPRPRTWTLAVEAGAVEPGLVEALGAARHADGRTAFRLVEPGSEPAPDLTVGAADGGLAYRGDALSVDHVMATNRFEQEVAAWRSAELQLVQAAPPFRGPPSDFDAYAPGMLVFAVLLLVPQTAFLVGRDVRRGTMDRLRLTGMSPWGYLGGVTLAQGIIAVLMGLLLLGLCLAWGYRFGGDRLVAGALTLAVLVVVGLSAVAVGLAVGPFVKSDSSALNLG